MTEPDDVENPLGLDITDEDRAMAAALSHVPDRAEIRSLLDEYFVGPITDAVVDRIETRFRETHAHRGIRSSYARDFESPSRWRGRAWNETLPLSRTTMTPRGHVLLLADMMNYADPSLPRPKMYCPERFVGTWRQTEPEVALDEPVRWHLAADGSFHSNNPDLPPGKTMWRIELADSNPDLFSLRLGGSLTWGWGIFSRMPTRNEIVGTEYFGQIEYRLVRELPRLQLATSSR